MTMRSISRRSVIRLPPLSARRPVGAVARRLRRATARRAVAGSSERKCAPTLLARASAAATVRRARSSRLRSSARAAVAHLGRAPGGEASGGRAEAGRVALEPDVLPHERLQRRAVDELRTACR